MVARVLPALLLLLTAFLASGCVTEEDPPAEDSGDATSGDDAQAGGSAPTPTPAATTGTANAGTHGQFKRTESAVTVRQDGSQYVATKTVTLTNGASGASAIDLALDTINGGIDVAPSGTSGYEVVATLQGRASSEQAARDTLAKLKVVHEDRLASGRLTLDTEIQFPSQSNGLAGSLKARVPAAPDLRVTADTSNGGVAVSGLSGPAATLSTTNGGISLAGDFTTATLSTSNGGIDVDGAVNILRATTTNGDIDGSVAPTASGTMTLETTNGLIDLVLEGGADHGFDATADTSNGLTEITLDDGSPVGSQSRTHKQVRTDGYDGKAVRVKVTASTTNGGIDIAQA